ncbi:hypothetical protein [Paenibacillus sedimenti]|uniref:Uncharacterized protein n=1 Tax=Paenibacillus sedimenti TaxID=2770274 RepID=A0A926KVL6_9BACL|nr:hypothetical protein [Paenibacillus sedimenti]MBD0382934.1 hypothetical protein [Paenibacillus sedimenti]
MKKKIILISIGGVIIIGLWLSHLLLMRDYTIRPGFQGDLNYAITTDIKKDIRILNIRNTAKEILVIYEIVHPQDYQYGVATFISPYHTKRYKMKSNYLTDYKDGINVATVNNRNKLIAFFYGRNKADLYKVVAYYGEKKMCEMQNPNSNHFIISCETDLIDKPTMLNVFLYDQKDALIEKKQIPIDNGIIRIPPIG